MKGWSVGSAEECQSFVTPARPTVSTAAAAQRFAWFSEMVTMGMWQCLEKRRPQGSKALCPAPASEPHKDQPRCMAFVP